MIRRKQATRLQFFVFGLLAFIINRFDGCFPRPIGLRPYQRGPESWAIGNDLVERVIRFDPNTGLRTTSWRNKQTGTEFITRSRRLRPPAGNLLLPPAVSSTSGAPTALLTSCRTALWMRRRGEKSCASCCAPTTSALR